MKIHISDDAFKWFKDEVGVKAGEKIKFYPQFYGSSPIQPGYSLAFTKENDIDPVATYEKEGILFFVENMDEWYFAEHDLLIEYDEKNDGIEYQYIEPKR